ncbi:MAG: hypothetical protein KBC96_07235 [Armatimonadetes bacterium]|nr:hypothetical protein [Armatimonadota bacterium]
MAHSRDRGNDGKKKRKKKDKQRLDIHDGLLHSRVQAQPGKSAPHDG